MADIIQEDDFEERIEAAMAAESKGKTMLWFIHHIDDNGDNKDLFIKTELSSVAVELWQDYFELEAYVMPSGLRRLPNVEHIPDGVIPWEKIPNFLNSN